MDGKEPMYGVPVINKSPKTEERQLDELGFAFVAKCIEVLETRGAVRECTVQRATTHSQTIKRCFFFGRIARARAVPCGRRFVQSEQITGDGLGPAKRRRQIEFGRFARVGNENDNERVENVPSNA